jgi:hypothetical protein
MDTRANGTHPQEAGYEAPKVERVLTAEELVREVQYAGTQVSQIDDV